MKNHVTSNNITYLSTQSLDRTTNNNYRRVFLASGLAAAGQPFCTIFSQPLCAFQQPLPSPSQRFD